MVRVPVVSFSRIRAARLLSWSSFLLTSAFRSLFLPKQDLVVALTTPPALSVVAAFCARLWSARFWIWEMDVYPDIAICLQEAQSDATWVRCLSELINWSRRSANGIFALGECMRARLTQGGVDPGKVVIAQNWTSGGKSEPPPVHNTGRSEYCIPETLVWHMIVTLSARSCADLRVTIGSASFSLVTAQTANT